MFEIICSKVLFYFFPTAAELQSAEVEKKNQI